MVKDLLFVLRQLRGRPGYATVAVLTLALGTGAATAMFSVVDHVLLRPLPFPAAGRLLALCETHASIEGFCVVSPPNAADWSATSRTLTSIGQARSWPFTMRAGERAEGVGGGYVSGRLFSTLQVTPGLGRLIADADVGPGRPRVAVLSEGYWRTRFGGDPGVIGRILDLDGVPHEVVGVLPAGIAVPTLGRVELWTPFPFDPLDEEQRRWRGFVTIGRMADGASVRAVEAELAALQDDLGRRFPTTNAGWGARVTPLLDTVVGSVRTLLLVFMGAVTMFLLIACANVANLLVGRTMARERELAIRVAVGASRGALARLLVLESLVIALAGGAVGAVAAASMAGVFVAMVPGGLPRGSEVTLDARVLVAAVLATLAAALVAALAPAVRAGRREIVEALRPGQPTAWRSALNLRSALVVTEVALTVIIAVGAGLLARSFAAHLDWKPGFDRSGLVTFWTFASDGTYLKAADVRALFRRIEEEIAAVPGVTSVGMVSNGPLFGGREPDEFHLVGASSDAPITANGFDTSPTYFATLGLPIRPGRAFTADDREGSPRVAIVNDTFVRRFLGGLDPIGQRLRQGSGDRVLEIVGVVPDVPPFAPGAAAAAEVYWPFAQSPRWASFFVVRSTVDTAAVMKAVSARLATVDPDLPVSNVATMDDRVSLRLAGPRFQMLLIGAFAAIALALALIGVYGVMAASVSGRRREIGVRIALGAPARRVLGEVLWQAFSLALAGTLIGLLGTAALSRVAGSLLVGVAPTDAASFAGVAVLVLAATVVAAFIPARRAATVDPLVALRTE